MKGLRPNKFGVISDDSQIFNRDPNLSRFFDDVKASDVNLTQEEERELILRAQTGDLSARNKLLEYHIRFCISVALKYRFKKLDINDIISACYTGFIKAIETFDVTKEYKLITHAVWMCRAEISKSYGRYGKTIRMPHGKSKSKEIDYDEMYATGDYSSAEYVDEKGDLISSWEESGHVSASYDDVFMQSDNTNSPEDICISNEESRLSFSKILSLMFDCKLSCNEKYFLLNLLGYQGVFKDKYKNSVTKEVREIEFILGDFNREVALDKYNELTGSNVTLHSVSTFILNAKTKLKRNKKLLKEWL